MTTSETILLAPLFFLLVFGLLQAGQLATALLVANYAASSVVRRAVQDNNSNVSQYIPRFTRLLTVGMKQPRLTPDMTGDGLMQNLTVHACAEVEAFPFVGVTLGSALASKLGTGTVDGCGNIETSIIFNRSLPPRFIVHGEAQARMNYKP